MPPIKISLGQDAFVAMALEPSSHYTCRSNGQPSYFVAIDATSMVAASDDYAEFWGGQLYTLVTTSEQYQFAAIGGAASPDTALPLDDPDAQIVTLEKFIPEAFVG